jgi:hypothetical protein
MLGKMVRESENMGERPTISDSQLREEGRRRRTEPIKCNDIRGTPLVRDACNGDADGESVEVRVRQVGGKSGNGALSRMQLFSENDPGYEKVSKWQLSKVTLPRAARTFTVFSAMTLLLIVIAAVV